jgi:putative Mg2+ transporter-C (MgtC) family protein
VFVVAAIGMAVGGGLYLPAVLATVLLLVALYPLGFLEDRWRLKPLRREYTVSGDDLEKTTAAVNRFLEQKHQAMQSVWITRTKSGPSLRFTIDTDRREHETLLTMLREAPGVHSVEQSEDWERE